MHVYYLRQLTNQLQARSTVRPVDCSIQHDQQRCRRDCKFYLSNNLPVAFWVSSNATHVAEALELSLVDVTLDAPRRQRARPSFNLVVSTLLKHLMYC